jgi:hypothetical protein
MNTPGIILEDPTAAGARGGAVLGTVRDRLFSWAEASDSRR